jgi:hypothetical protein
MIPRRAGVLALGLVAAGAIAWTAISQTEHATPNPDAALSPDLQQGNSADSAPAPAAAPARKAAPTPPPVTSETPMAERVAVIGLLNKRNGESRDATLHPGQGVRWGDLIVRLRACETTADWEDEQLTGAFVQADKRASDGSWHRIFSGWLYKESPSLNVVEDPLYDVWPKSCTMRHPDIGPATVAATSSGAAPRSIAKKSAGDATSPPAAGAEPKPSAPSNHAT